MKILYGLLLTLVTATCFAKPEIKIALELSKNDPYEVHHFQNGHYFAGQNQSAAVNYHRIDIYDPSLTKLIQTIPLVHTVESIAPLDKTRTIVIGKHWEEEWLGYFTILTPSTSGYTAKTTTLPREVQPEFFAGTPQQMYFNEVGVRGIFQFTTSGPKMLPISISGVGRLAFTGQYLYAIERANLLEEGDENLVRVQLSTHKAEKTFTENRQLISNLLWLPDLHRLAVTETNANLVHLVDPDTNRVSESLTVPSPRGLARIKNCLLVSSQMERRVSFLRLSNAGTTISGDWDLADAPDQLINTRGITADESTRRVYLRSIDICPTCVKTRNVVVIAEEKEAGPLASCMG